MLVSQRETGFLNTIKARRLKNPVGTKMEKRSCLHGEFHLFAVVTGSELSQLDLEKPKILIINYWNKDWYIDN